jgi:hypothetical protein
MTTRPPASPSSQFSALLSRFGPETIALVKQYLPRIRRAVPCTHEIVYAYPHSVVVSFSMSERGYEGIVTIAIKADELRLYFSRDLPDPKGLLEGSGGKVRFVTINDASDLDRAEIKALFKAAIALHKRAVATIPRSGSPRMIIKSASKKNSKTKTKKR